MPLSENTLWCLTVDEELQRRLAANEVIFRDVNESIERGQWPGEADSQVGFRCECARLGCNLLLNLTLAEYEHVRSDPRRFVMISGHEVPNVETVIEDRGDYVIVEKRDDAGAHAESCDPRT
ncbi:MAG TPA: hypothetical protein VGL51_14885 [Solirubrobacteraceae bacterium]|jgi:hypothetical protein